MPEDLLDLLEDLLIDEREANSVWKLLSLEFLLS